ncbi:MAG: adenylate/guanylate cyclase domain-containing protein [Gemmatimonadales bacterium]
MDVALPSSRPVSSRSTCDAGGLEVCGLDPTLLPKALAIRDWLLTEAAQLADPGQISPGLAERLIALGIPIDRIMSAIDLLHSEYSGVGRIWTKEEGTTSRFFPHSPDGIRVAYNKSPFAHVHRTRDWLLLDLAQTPDDRFNIIPDLKAAGYRHYLVVPIFFTNGTHHGRTFATRAPDGFGEQGLRVLRSVVPTVAAMMEIRVLHHHLDNVLRIYVGDEPHRAILSGVIRRGRVTCIHSAILFADMRDYTRITATLSPEVAVQLLNGYFDCLVPPIEAQGGEVLKYMGDGLLAIFREGEEDRGSAAQAALAAAVQALAQLEAANDKGRFPNPISAGIALHHGEAAYGNVGSGVRLDFTVIGPDVNLASRIAKLNKVLGEPLLMSQAFVDVLPGRSEPLGAHAVDGFAQAVPIYRPAQ